MALDFQKLENLRPCAEGHRAACPACREDDGDRKGNHLFIGEDGRYGCAAQQGDGDHRRRVFELAGVSDLQRSFGKAGRQQCTSRQRKGELNRRKLLTAEAATQLESILRCHHSDDWTADLWHESPLRLDGDPKDDWKLMIGTLFPMDATLFIGDLHDSGDIRGKGHFQTVTTWLECPTLPGPRVSAATFRAGTVHRSKDCINERPFLILESDELIGHKPANPLECEKNKGATASLFQWLVIELGMRMAAVVDTGNRSLHGWFRMPRRAGFLPELESIAPALRLDPALFHQPNAPIRLPGAIHEKTGTPARLLYLDQMI